MMSRLCFAAALFVLCGLAHGHFNRCFPLLGKYPFDEQKLSGEWYAVAATHKPAKTIEGKCFKVTYSAEKVGNVTRTHMLLNIKGPDDAVKTYEAKGEGLKPGMASVTSVVFKKPDSDKWEGVFQQSILATDYVRYVLEHGCKENYDEKTDTFGKVVGNKIWSKTPTMDEALLKTLKSVMSSLDVADGDWLTLDNSGC